MDYRELLTVEHNQEPPLPHLSQRIISVHLLPEVENRDIVEKCGALICRKANHSLRQVVALVGRFKVAV